MPRRRTAVACLTAVLVIAGCSARTGGIAATAVVIPVGESAAGNPGSTDPSDEPAAAAPEPSTTSPIAEGGPTTHAPETSEPSSADTGPAGGASEPEEPDPDVAAGDLPDVGMDGVNDPACTPDLSVGPPVLLVHGTFSTASSNFGNVAPALIADGRCVYAIDYGQEGSAPVDASAADVAAFAQGVLALTGTEQLDVVGYSQGGLVLRTALRENGLADQVRVAALIAPTFHGTDSPLVKELIGESCLSCADQVVGSDLLERLNAGGDLDGTVRYAVVSTQADQYVTPVESQVPDGPDDRVVSIVVEDVCPQVQTDHISILGLPGVATWVADALRTGGQPDAGSLTCE